MATKGKRVRITVGSTGSFSVSIKALRAASPVLGGLAEDTIGDESIASITLNNGRGGETSTALRAIMIFDLDPSSHARPTAQPKQASRRAKSARSAAATMSSGEAHKIVENLIFGPSHVNIRASTPPPRSPSIPSQSRPSPPTRVVPRATVAKGPTARRGHAAAPMQVQVHMQVVQQDPHRQTQARSKTIARPTRVRATPAPAPAPAQARRKTTARPNTRTVRVASPKRPDRQRSPSKRPHADPHRGWDKWTVRQQQWLLKRHAKPERPRVWRGGDEVPEEDASA